jgi:peptidoglycan hydrolase-like protein with peptidoglycan-binding domain
MKTLTLLATGTLVLALTTTQAQASDRGRVEQAQRALEQAGHDPGPIDGVVGPKTSAALRAYQKAHGLDATGRLDDATLGKLTAGGDSPSASVSGSGARQTGGTGSQQTGGDTRPNAVDPAQATKTGANASEGASYSRSTEKGDSTLSGRD